MPREARLEQTEHGLAPADDGWFVANFRELRWMASEEFGDFASIDWGVNWPDFGFNVGVLGPGEPMCLYHGESNREVFLVLTGNPLLLVEGEERRLKPWDVFHCAPWTEHVLVGGDTPSVVVAASTRAPDSKVRYVSNEVSRKHAAAPGADTDDPSVAYARFAPLQPRAYRDGDLP